MAVTRKGRSIVMTAASDAYLFAVKCRQIRFSGTGLTAGQRLLIKEQDTNGAVVADHYVTAAQEDFAIWECADASGQWVRKPFIDIYPAGGTSTILFQIN